MTERETSRRLTVQEAAEVLGTSVDAVRMRVRRGTLHAEKEVDGRVYVRLDSDSSETKHQLDGEPTALISAKDETIRVLSEQLGSERDARRRADTIIAQLTQANASLAARVPELDAPAESPSEWAADEEAAREDASMSTRSDRQRQGWWRRVFGG